MEELYLFLINFHYLFLYNLYI